MAWMAALAAISAMSKSGTQSGSGTSSTLGIDGKITQGAENKGAGTGNVTLLKGTTSAGVGDASKSNADAGFANPSGANYQDATKMSAPSGFAFYGGETAEDIRRICPVKIVGGEKTTTKNETSFYNDVIIPRKKV